MAEDLTYGDIHRSRSRCPKFDGKKGNWKNYYFQYQAWANTRRKPASDIAKGAKPPNERKGQYYEEYAADAGGWEELMCLASPREQARYKTAVISQLAKDQAAWDKEMSAQFNELSLACSHDALTTLMGESVDGNVMKAIAQFKQMYGTETEGRRFTLLKKFLDL